MATRDDLVDAIDAAQADRIAANNAGQSDLVNRIHAELVVPLTRQLAHMALETRPDTVELQLMLLTLDNGIAALAATAASLTNSRGMAERLRLKLSGGAAPPQSVNPDIPSEPPVPILDTPNPAPDGTPGLFIFARRTGSLVIVYVDAEGRDVVRQGGSRSWRNNNPGNIRRGNFSVIQGAIGDDGAFAIFPDEETGFAAIVALLRSPSYISLSLEGAINRYAPPSENNTSSYLTFVETDTQIPRNTLLSSLKIAQIRRIAQSIRAMEGWIPGSERPHRPVSGTVVADTSSGISSAIGAVQEWMSIAEREAALPERERSEWVDPEENPRILEYFRVAAAWFEHDGDETDWCAAFVNFCLVASGHIGTDHPGARSFFWNKKNQFIKLEEPAKGCIAVMRRAPFDNPLWPTGRGHVGFVVSSTSTSLTLLGGNQDKTVCHKVFPREMRDSDGKLTAQFVAFMMPVMN